MSIFSNKKGFTLLEVIISILVLTVGLVAALAAIQRATALISLSSLELRAAYLGQEGVEIVRNIRDANWLQGEDWNRGLTGCGSGCQGDYTMTELAAWSGNGDYLNIDNNGFYSYSPGEETRFKRKIIIDNSNSDILNIRVEVTWTERGRDYEFFLREDLYNWF